MLRQLSGNLAFGSPLWPGACIDLTLPASSLGMPEQAKDCPDVIAFPPILFGGMLAVGMLLQLAWPLALTQWHPSRWIGGGLALLSAFLAKWGESAMRRAGTSVRPTQPTTAIVQDGPFRFTRNPLYLSLTMLYVGICLMFNALLPLALLPALLLVVHFGIVRREERYLESKFGEPYRQYCKRVRRWL